MMFVTVYMLIPNVITAVPSDVLEPNDLSAASMVPATKFDIFLSTVFVNDFFRWHINWWTKRLKLSGGISIDIWAHQSCIYRVKSFVFFKFFVMSFNLLSIPIKSILASCKQNIISVKKCFFATWPFKKPGQSTYWASLYKGSWVSITPLLCRPSYQCLQIATICQLIASWWVVAS